MSYADDIVLLCPTHASVDKMLDICNIFSTEYYITCNATKSKLLSFGSENTRCKIVFQGNVIPVAYKEKHVGNLFGTNATVNQEIITNSCNEMYAKLNLLFRQFAGVNKHIMYMLFKLFCMFFYGSQIWNLAKCCSK